MRITRRRFAGLGALALAAPMIGAAIPPRVVVVGGGPGGATVARYLAMEGQGAIEVTLIEPARAYATCFFSNLYLSGLREMDSLIHRYDRLADDYGINVIHDMAMGIDRDASQVALGSGGRLHYDRLVLAPGIDFVEGAVPGWSLASQARMPHAYKGGTQVALLRRQLESMREGGTFVLVAPPDPYRCPPGPYERVSMVAMLLSQINPRAKILIVDPKPKFSKQALFEEIWPTRYGNMIERLGPDFGGDKVTVDAQAMTVDVDGEVIAADVCNVIPAMRAGEIAHRAGLTQDGWVPVLPATLQSRADPSIHVLGDAAAQGDMPKSAFAANSQAHVCARAILAQLSDRVPGVARFENTCWSLISENNAVKVGATYEATDEKIARVDGFISQIGEPAELRHKNYDESLGWYAGMTADIFG